MALNHNSRRSVRNMSSATECLVDHVWSKNSGAKKTHIKRWSQLLHVCLFVGLKHTIIFNLGHQQVQYCLQNFLPFFLLCVFLRNIYCPGDFSNRLWALNIRFLKFHPCIASVSVPAIYLVLNVKGYLPRLLIFKHYQAILKLVISLCTVWLCYNVLQNTRTRILLPFESL